MDAVPVNKLRLRAKPLAGSHTQDLAECELLETHQLNGWRKADTFSHQMQRQHPAQSQAGHVAFGLSPRSPLF